MFNAPTDNSVIKPFGGFFIRRGASRWFVSETIGQMGTRQPVMLTNSPKAPAASAALHAVMHHCAVTRANNLAVCLPAVEAAVAPHGFRAMYCPRDAKRAERIAVLPLPGDCT